MDRSLYKNQNYKIKGKRNYAEWDEYINNKESLLCDNEIELFNQLFDKSIQTDKEQSYRFAVKTKDRTIRIYKECYSLLSKIFENGTFELLDSEVILSKRKTIIESLLSILGEQTHVFYSFNGEEFEIKQELEWAMPELTIGVTHGNKMACMYFHIENNINYNYWVGIGKAPNKATLEKEELQSFKDYQK